MDDLIVESTTSSTTNASNTAKKTKNPKKTNRRRRGKKRKIAETEISPHSTTIAPPKKRKKTTSKKKNKEDDCAFWNSRIQYLDTNNSLTDFEDFADTHSLSMEAIIKDNADAERQFDVDHLSISDYLYLFNHGLCGLCVENDYDGHSWVQCVECIRWDHKACLPKKDRKKYKSGSKIPYICELCKK